MTPDARRRPPRVLAIVADVGERQVDSALAALTGQRHVDVTVHRISGLPMLEAQEAVYAAACDAGTRDRIMKFDGDMELRGDTALAKMVERAVRCNQARYSEPVSDWYTGKQIPAVHLFQPSAVPAGVTIKRPRTDAWLTQIQGFAPKAVWRPCVRHATDPDTAQALRYGLQRGLKALAGDPRSQHWVTIAHLTRRQRHSRSVVRAFAVAGASLVVAKRRIRDPTEFSTIDRDSSAFAPSYRSTHPMLGRSQMMPPPSCALWGSGEYTTPPISRTLKRLAT